MRSRIDNLTGIRGFAALWVIAFHAGTSWRRGGAVLNHGYFGVDIFFVLSGYVLSLAYANNLPTHFSRDWYQNQIKRRLAKIYPVHLLTFLLSVAIFLLGKLVHYHFQNSAENTLWTALCNILLIHAFGTTRDLSWNIPSWSVSAEWFAYTVLFAIFSFRLRRIKVRFVLLNTAILWIAYVVYCHEELHRNTALNTLGMLRITPEFLCGYLLFRLTNARRSALGDLFALCGCATLLAVSYAPEACAFFILPAISIMLVGLYFGGPVTNNVFGNKGSVWLGEVSFSTYMIQDFVFIFINQAFRRFHVQQTASALVIYIIAACIGSFAVGSFVFSTFEEPLRQTLLRKMRSRPGGPEHKSPSEEQPLSRQDTQVSATIS